MVQQPTGHRKLWFRPPYTGGHTYLSSYTISNPTIPDISHAFPLRPQHRWNLIPNCFIWNCENSKYFNLISQNSSPSHHIPGTLKFLLVINNKEDFFRVILKTSYMSGYFKRSHSTLPFIIVAMSIPARSPHDRLSGFLLWNENSYSKSSRFKRGMLIVAASNKSADLSISTSIPQTHAFKAMHEGTFTITLISFHY